MTKKQVLTITTRTSDGAIGIRFNGRHVVTITKSGRRARIAGKNLRNIPRGMHRGVNKFQFDPLISVQEIFRSAEPLEGRDFRA